MKKRSPKSPRFSLEEGLKALTTLSEKIGTEAVDREKVAELLGYSSLNGPARGLLAAMVGYGLLERRPFKISPLGHALLENMESLPMRRRAALSPRVFRMMFRRARDIAPQELIQRMIKHGFTEKGANRAVEVFAENKAFAKLDEMTVEPGPEGKRGGRKGPKGQRRGPGRDGKEKCGKGPRGERREGRPHGRPRHMGPPPAAVFRVPVGAGNDAELRFFGQRPSKQSIGALRKYLDLIESEL